MFSTKKPGTKRLSLQVSEQVQQELEALKTAIGAESLAEVLQKALASYHFLRQETDAGRTLVLKDDNGEEIVELP